MSDDRIKIIDFGFSCAVEACNCQRVGVPAYYEPELAMAQLHGDANPAPSLLGEQYSVASLAYQVLMGRHYLESTPGRLTAIKDELLRQITDLAPCRMSTFSDGVPSGIEQVVMKGLSKNPGSRHKSMTEFANSFLTAVADSTARRSVNLPAVIRGELEAGALINEIVEFVIPRVEIYSIVDSNPPTCSVACGAAGIAFGLYRIACAQSDPKLLSCADIWCTRTVAGMNDRNAFFNTEFDMTPDFVGKVSPYNALSGIFCTQALIGAAMANTALQANAIGQFIKFASEPRQDLDPYFGSPGALIGCSVLLRSVATDQPVEAASLRVLGTRVMADICEAISKLPPIADCSEITKLGAAHGWAGILYSILKWCNVAGISPPSCVETRLHELEVLGVNNGRGTSWPIDVRAGGFMPSWCNGVPGFVYLWTEAYRAFKADGYLSLAERSCWATWIDRDANMVLNLCCGSVGRSYALLNFFRITREAIWLERAREIALQASNLSVSGYSLYKGGLGLAVLLSDLRQPEHSAMPMYEPEA